MKSKWTMLLICGLFVGPALADKGHDHAPGQYKEPQTFGQAMGQIRTATEAVRISVEAEDLASIHPEAEAIARSASLLGKLALTKGSGVAKQAVKQINTTSKSLAAAAERVHETADRGDLASTQQAFAKLSELVEALSKSAPPQYACPMDCEPGKFSTAPGECAHCGMDLKKITSEKYSVEVKPESGEIVAGQPVTLVFTFKTPGGGRLRKFENVHEKLLHLLMVSEDLSWYAHEHPEIQDNGTFKLTFSFPKPGRYILYNDFTPPDVGQQVVQVPIVVPGSSEFENPLELDTNASKVVEGYTVSLATGDGLRVGESSTLTYTVSRDGKPVTDLEPYLGAMGHLVIISRDLKHFVHSHPHEDAPSVDAPKPGVIEFQARFRAPGLYKGWGQFQHQGRILTVPFTMQVMPRPKVAAK